MIRLIEENRSALVDACKKHRVRRLDLFGSAADGSFDEDRSDVDFLVEFDPLDSAEYADHYFGLLETLESLFGRRVDLVIESAIRNPYFLEGIRRSRIELYAARGPEVPLR